MEIISRKEAKEQELKTYFTGKPCKYGHVAEKYTRSGACVECQYLSGTEYRNANRDLVNANRRNIYDNNKEEISLKVKERYETDEEFREMKLESKRKWFQENKGHCVAYNTARRVAKKKALPLWANLDKIDAIYKNANGMDVDHIVPLNGKLASGLHVEFNLQYLEHINNLKKHNKFIPFIEKDGEITELPKELWITLM